MKVSIIAHPNSKKPRIEKDLLGTFHVYVNAPPLKGKANRAVVNSLAKHFGVRTNKIMFVSGMRLKKKVFEILKEQNV